jgi:hypothetical protein
VTAVNLKPDEARKVKIEVQNAFGHISKREITLVRERTDGSVPMEIEAKPRQTAGLPGGPGGNLHGRGGPSNQPEKALEQGAH